jgi:hypothetical protein
MGRSRDERGIALPSPVAALSLAAVLLAGVAFVATTEDQGTTPEAAVPVVAEPEPTSTAPEPVLEKKPRPRRPTVDRGEVYVEVYNNSGVSGLAGATARNIGGAGWQVVGSDNWYGTIPQSTVYYPERLRVAARTLARDLGIERLKPAIAPMRFDRLTVILTADYA